MACLIAAIKNPACALAWKPLKNSKVSNKKMNK